MAYETFIPRVEVANFLKDLERNLVFAQDCSREYEGEVKRRGDSVRFLMAGKPTIYDLEKDETGGTRAPNANGGTGKDVIQKNIGDFEEIENASKVIQINQINYFHYGIGDIDKHQMDRNMANQYREEASKGIADKIDRYIAKIMANERGIRYDISGAQVITKDTVLDFIDNLVLKMNDNEVTDNTQLVMEVSPRFWKVLKQAYRDLDTDNSELLAGRKVGRYNDIIIKKTTGCYKANGTDEFIFIRTRRAVGFANPLTEIKAYSPEKAFSDAVKGFTLYDATILREKEVLAQIVSY